MTTSEKIRRAALGPKPPANRGGRTIGTWLPEVFDTHAFYTAQNYRRGGELFASADEIQQRTFLLLVSEACKT